MLDGDASFPLIFSQPAHGLFQVPAASSAGLTIAIGFPGGSPFDAPARARNYTPRPDRETGDMVSVDFGGSEDFLHFIAEELRASLSELYPLIPQDKHCSVFLMAAFLPSIHCFPVRNISSATGQQARHCGSVIS